MTLSLLHSRIRRFVLRGAGHFRTYQTQDTGPDSLASQRNVLYAYHFPSRSFVSPCSASNLRRSLEVVFMDLCLCSSPELPFYMLSVVFPTLYKIKHVCSQPLNSACGKSAPSVGNITGSGPRSGPPRSCEYMNYVRFHCARFI
jgi:hypothetical protein